MKKAKKKNEIISLSLTAMIIVVLVFSGMTSAIDLTITADNTEPDEQTDVSFIVQVDIDDGEKIPIETLTVNITKASDSSVIATCVFLPDGTNQSACADITIDIINITEPIAYDYDSTYGYGFGYGYGSGADDYYNTIYFPDGPTPGDAYHGYEYVELKYNITWTTPDVDADTDYEIEFNAYAEAGNEFTYKTTSPKTITVQYVPEEASADDNASVADAKEELDYEMILMDDSPDAKNRVISDLYLPATLDGVTIEWESNNTSVISTDGEVARQDANTSVTLTATLTKNAAEDIKEFDLIVKQIVEAAVPNEEGEVVVNASETEVVISATNIQNLTLITVPSTVDKETPVVINLQAVVDESTGSTPPLENELNLTRETDQVTYEVEIPSGTIISGGLDWNGIITLPTVVNEENYSIDDGEVEIVIELGSTIEINFSKPVKIILDGQTGKSAGWTRGDTELIEIETTCNSATTPTIINNVSPRICSISSDGDLIIWTYHFTKFAAFTPDDDGGSSSSGGSSPPTTCSSIWSCTAWSTCKLGDIKKRVCTDLNSCSGAVPPSTEMSCTYIAPDTPEPVVVKEPEVVNETIDFIMEEVIDEPQEQEETPQNTTEKTTKPVVVVRDDKDYGWFTFILVLFLIIAAIILLFVYKDNLLWQYEKSKYKKSKNKKSEEHKFSLIKKHEEKHEHKPKKTHKHKEEHKPKKKETHEEKHTALDLVKFLRILKRDDNQIRIRLKSKGFSDKEINKALKHK